MRERTVKAANPKVFAQALVAALGADKGVPAIFVETATPGIWAVVTDTLTLTIEPSNEPA